MFFCTDCFDIVTTPVRYRTRHYNYTTPVGVSIWELQFTFSCRYSSPVLLPMDQLIVLPGQLSRSLLPHIIRGFSTQRIQDLFPSDDRVAGCAHPSTVNFSRHLNYCPTCRILFAPSVLLRALLPLVHLRYVTSGRCTQPSWPIK